MEETNHDPCKNLQRFRVIEASLLKIMEITLLTIFETEHISRILSKFLMPLFPDL